MDEIDGKRILKEASAFDEAAREALARLFDEYPMTKTGFTAIISVLAWELRDQLSPDYLRQTEIIALYLCKIRGIKGYPLGGFSD